MTKLFFDTEFTGLHQKTTLISIGIISECGKTFYAEFTDYNKRQVDNWLQENVISKLFLYEKEDFKIYNVGEKAVGKKVVSGQDTMVLGNKQVVKQYLKEWLSQFEKVEMWSDCLSYDWVLFCQIFGHAFKIPENVYYIPYDICTLFKVRGIDPDISREKFGCSEHYHEIPKHNSLWDARVIKMCYEKLMISKA